MDSDFLLSADVPALSQPEGTSDVSLNVLNASSFGMVSKIAVLPFDFISRSLKIKMPDFGVRSVFPASE